MNVALLERLKYPGGCASTFERGGARYEAGATLFSGFGEGQLFADWIERHGLDVDVQSIDPMVELRTPGFTLAVPPDRDAFIDRLCALPGAPVANLRAFFDEQRRVADALWEIFASPEMLPPFGPGALWQHARRLPRYLPLARLIGRPLGSVLMRHGLADFAPLRTYLDAVCQITVQTSAAEAEAPFAMATMDYYFRGTGHVHGGIGRLAWALVHAIETLGGEVRLADGVRRIERMPDGWRVHARKGVLEAPVVVANLLPQDLRRLAGIEPAVSPRLDTLEAAVNESWGAAMLYVRVAPDAVDRPEAHHLELVQDPDAPFLEGNHLFCSISGQDETRAEDDSRTVTVSTHLDVSEAEGPEWPAHVARVQERMRTGLARLAPSLWAGTRHELTASPRTFARFTGRHRGFVGGIPRRAGLRNYQHAWPGPVLPGLYLVGDTVFPGQSTLATALGGVKLADHLRRKSELSARAV